MSCRRLESWRPTRMDRQQGWDMDPTKEEQLAQEQMDELKEALRLQQHRAVNNSGAVTGTQGYGVLAQEISTVTLSSPGTQPYANVTIGNPYVTAGAGLTYTGPNITVPNGGSTTGVSIGAGSGYNWSNISANWNWGTGSSTTHGQLNLEGENADITINGVSLMDLLQDRLALLVPNPALEKEWDELKELGEKYRAVEAKIKEQTKMWDKLKSMPPPETKY